MALLTGYTATPLHCTQGPFFNYVDQMLQIIDHLQPPVDIGGEILLLKVNSMRILSCHKGQ